MGLLRQLAHRLLSEERDSEFGYFDYVAAQKRVEQMSMVNEDIQSLEDMITDMQMYRRGNREGVLTLQWFDCNGEEKELELWLDGDFSENTTCGELIQFLRHERTRQRTLLRRLLKSG
ncbi:MAG: hypothetical protein ACLT3Y_01355 [Ruminococcus callidus]